MAKQASETPWTPGAVARRTVGLLTLVTLLLTGVVIVLSMTMIKISKAPPKLVTNNLGTFVEAQIQPLKISRDDVERFIQLVIPRLHAQSNGESPGLEQIATMVNSNILAKQIEEMESKSAQLKTQGVTQFAIVNGINPSTLVINREKKTIYAEAVGIVGLTDKSGRARTVPTQWQLLIYMVDIIPTSATSGNPGSETIGNERGLYLQQFVEQTPGDINQDIPKPSQNDLKEYEEQQQLRKEKAELMRILRNNSVNDPVAPESK